MTCSKTVSAIILVGGASRRFGSPKTDLVVGEVRLLDRTTRLLQSVVGSVPIQIGTTALPDRRPGHGPLAGIETALEIARTPWLLIVACDMPGLSKELLTLLASHADREDVLVPVYNGQKHPLCARWHRRCLYTVRALLDAGQRSVHSALAALRTRTLDEDELRAAGVRPHRALRNVNHPEDLQAHLRDISP